MEQLIFELATTEPPSFANFVAGANREAVTALMLAASGGGRETGTVIWGPPGAGKSHLMRATVAAAEAAVREARFAAAPAEVGDWADAALVAVDAIDQADSAAQARLFSLYNALRDRGAHLVAAGSRPPGRMALRDDLRTRLGWGLIFEIQPLGDADKPAALTAYARQRGFGLSDDVIAYLLAHGRRDMPSLVATLAALDRHSLAVKRAVTVPLLREWLQREMGLGPPQ